MDDNDQEEQQDDYGEDALYHACYIYRSPHLRESSSHQPLKKRKLTHDPQLSGGWPKLPEHNDSSELAAIRQLSLTSALERQREACSRQNEVDLRKVDDLLSFIEETVPSNLPNHVAAALLLTGLDTLYYDGVLTAASDGLSKSTSTMLVNIQSRQCPNLQTALKNIIRAVMVQHSDLAAYNKFLLDNKRLFPLNFDLELLEKFTTEHSITRVILSLRDVENFDGSTINDLVSTIHLWRRRIPCLLLLGIKSTQELFEHRLSKACLKLLHARVFDFAPQKDHVSGLLHAVQIPNHVSTSRQAFLGPNLVKVLHDLSQTQGYTASSLASTLRYLFISHYIANPVSVLSDSDVEFKDPHSIQIAARIARATSSFRLYCDGILSQRSKTANAKVKSLLEDDHATLAEVREKVSTGTTAYRAACSMIHHLSELYQTLSRYSSKLHQPRLQVESQLYQAIQDLTDSDIFDDIRDCLHTLDEFQLRQVLENHDSLLMAFPTSDVAGQPPQSYEDFKRQAAAYENGDDGHHEHLSNSNSRRKKSSKAAQPPSRTITQRIMPCSSLAQDVVTLLAKNLKECSVDISSCLLHEAYIISSHALHFKQNFDSQPRATIERALLRPGDYLTCDCCGQRHREQSTAKDANGILTDQEAWEPGTMPPACTLFTMLQEAPTIVNVRDMYDAFCARSGQIEDINCDSTDDSVELKSTMMLFYRSLAELKMLGLVKGSTGAQVKKRPVGGRNSKAAAQDVDFIAKTGWSGL